MAGRKSDFTLPTLDDLFSTQELRDDAKLSKIRDIPLELIDDFPDHPFKVRDDEDMIQLVESVKERGVITPATVRQKEDGRYELISGHRRKRACELAGFEALRCEVVDLDRDAATVLMVESNYQRSQILPSEKAFAYKMRLEAMKRQAGRPAKENASPLATNFPQGRSDTELGEQVGESKDQVRRYIRLTNLVPELLELVDEGKIKMRPAVELSYLDEDSQRAVVDEIDLNQSYCAVCLEGAVIVLSCIIFSLFASSPPVVNPDAAAVTQVWSYIGELLFNMLVLVGSVKMSNRIIREMMGL